MSANNTQIATMHGSRRRILLMPSRIKYLSMCPTGPRYRSSRRRQSFTQQ